MQKIFKIVCLVLFSATAWSIPPLPVFNQTQNEKTDFDVFPISSEMQIGKILHMVQLAPRGVYLTVGSERGFRAASMFPKITYLIQLDIAEPIIQLNKINKELLKAASRQDYLKLRWEADFSKWEELKEEIEREYGTQVNLQLEDYEWWVKNVRDIEAMPYKLPEYLNRYQKSPECKNEELTELERKLDLGQILDYKSGNYLFSDQLYQNIHQLALDNKILTAKINLMDPEEVKKLVEYLNKNQLKIGVLDLDNLYFQDYMGQDSYLSLINNLLPLGTDHSMLIAMSNYKDFACGQFQLYLGFNFEHVKQWPKDFKMQDFIDSIPEPVQDLIDGRVYKGEDQLPNFL